MTRIAATPCVLVLLLLTCMLQAMATVETVFAADHEYRELALEGGGKLSYAVQLPQDYDSLRAYPLLLALPPGPQNRAMVEAGFGRYWGDPARDRGWIVVSPAAPGGKLFFRGGENHLGALLRQIRIDFRVDGNRMHLAGASSGGRSAFRLALEHPHEFQSLVVLPGFPPEEQDHARLALLEGITIHMFVGGEDRGWVKATNRTVARLTELGIPVTHTVLPGEGHVPPSMDGDRIMKLLADLHARGSVDATTPEGQVAAALDDFHDAAAKGDEERYFGRFAPEGVFLGTDATERWTVEAFRSWGERYFQRPSAWIYVPVSRHIGFSLDGDLAWFDETLGNAHLGECRGSGVLRRIDGAWRISQYNLTVPIPNALVDGVVESIRRAAVGDAAATPGGVTSVYLVRHAEKVTDSGNDDPPLTDAGEERARALERALRSVPLAAIYTSQYRRTRDTVAPLAERSGLSPVVIDAAEVKLLVDTLKGGHAGDAVLVCGHSNTLPAIMTALGVPEAVTIADSDYDRLFVVSISDANATLTRLHFGVSPPRR